MANVDLLFKTEHAEVVKLLMQKGVIDFALHTYCEHSGEAERYEVCVEESGIGFEVRVRGFNG
jgi:hypothetical protein